MCVGIECKKSMSERKERPMESIFRSPVWIMIRGFYSGRYLDLAS